MANNETGKAPTPKVAAPYLSFITFLNSFDPFTQGIPPKLNRELWKQSGLTQGLIMNTLRFFKLIDDQDQPTQLFHQVVAAKGDKRKPEIANLLRLSYPSIFEHDLMTMTPKMLDEQLEKYNVGGETKKKAATFFLQAAKYANIPLGNFLTEKIRNTGGPRKARVKRTEQIENPAMPIVASGSGKSVRLSGGGVVTLTASADVFSLGKEDRDFVFGLIDTMTAYEENHIAPDDDEEDQ